MVDLLIMEMNVTESNESNITTKTDVNIGAFYQAQIPEGLSKYGDTLPYENEDKLMWNTGIVNPQYIENYLVQAAEFGLNHIPMGKGIRDDERALFVLLQCGHNIEEALRRLKLGMSSPLMNTQDCIPSFPFLSEEECKGFEEGLYLYGKNFRLIQINKVRTRSVGELVHFYYFWKKSERYDLFPKHEVLVDRVRPRRDYTNNYRRKCKIPRNPNTVDHTEKYLEPYIGALTKSTSDLTLHEVKLEKTEYTEDDTSNDVDTNESLPVIKTENEEDLIHEVKIEEEC